MALGPEDIASRQFPVKVWGYDKDKVDEFLQQVSTDFRELLRAARSTVQPPPPARSSFEELGDQVVSILDSAAQGADELKLAAEREAQAIRAAAAEEAAETVEAALDQLEAANKAKATAESEAEAVRAAARYEAGRVEQEAIERAARLEQDAREKAADLERAANANVTAVLAEARRRYEHLRQAERKSMARLAAVETLISKAREELPEDELEPGDDDYALMPELEIEGDDSFLDVGGPGAVDGEDEADSRPLGPRARPGVRTTERAARTRRR